MREENTRHVATVFIIIFYLFKKNCYFINIVPVLPLCNYTFKLMKYKACYIK